MNDLRNFKLFTHAGCMDGSAAAILFMHAGGLKSNINLIPAGHVEEYWSASSAATSYTPVLFVDVAPSTAALARTLSNRTDTFIIDHHASAKRFVGMDGFVIDVNNNACGSENFRRWLVEQGFDKFRHPAFRRFTQIIDDHDRWQKNIPFSTELPKLFSFVGQWDFVDRMYDVYSRFGAERDEYWTPFEKELMKLVSKSQDRRFSSLLKKFVKVQKEYDGKVITIGYTVNGEINVSELLNVYLEQNQDVDVACQINIEQNRVSIRSNGKVNMTEYAGRYGGGGHANAGGHPLPDNVVASIAEMIHGQDIRRG